VTKSKIIEFPDIVVTGMGVVTAHGNLEQTVNAMLMRRSSITALIPDFPEFGVCPTTIGGVIRDFDLCQYGFSDRDAKRIASRATRSTQFAHAAVNSALRHAGLLEENPYELERCGANIGTGIGSSELLVQIGIDIARLESGELDFDTFVRQHLGDIIKLLPDASAYQTVKIKGPLGCSIKACATGLGNIRRAANEIYLGIADMMIAGATESLYPCDVMPFNIYAKSGALSRQNDKPEEASRPFDGDHDGFVPAEGAGILILESEEKARKRNARIFARLIGLGETTDGNGSTTDPDKDGQVTAMANALSWAGLLAEDTLGKIVVVTHATSTPSGDGVELSALREVFGDSREVYITAPKSMLGHTLGASGAIQAATAILAATRGFIYPTINLRNPIPEALICNQNHEHDFRQGCYLNIVRENALMADVRYVMCNAFGFGGQNVCVLFEML
jgi:3-oxoacyl-[acyl-carrier-protein] synthase II